MDTYKATNTLNGKFYIGSSKNFEERKKAHLGSKCNYPFQNALRKNPEAFEWEVWTDNSENREFEQALLDMWFGKEQCYNLNSKASCPPQNPWTEERKNKHRIRVSRQFKGIPKKQESVIKMRQTKKNNKWVPDQNWRNKLSVRSIGNAYHKGHKDSEESRKKKSKSHKGEKWWVNALGETTRSRESPGDNWQKGRVWKG